MKKILVALMAVAALCAYGQERPKLVVGIVVDQMRWDYLYTYGDHWGEKGFKTLLHDGYCCNNTMIDYVPTVTAVGHASIYTGTTPAFHGIAGNNFLINGKNVTSVEDANYLSVGGNGQAGGKSPKNLITTTIGDQLRIATNFKSRTVGIALKDRAAILPAGHKPAGAYWYDGKSKNFITSTYYMDKLPKWVSNFNKKHKAELSTEVSHLPTGTTLTFALAEEALINEKLGQGEVTDMLTISVSNTDQCAHMYGTYTPKVDSIYWQLDKEIAHFIDVLDNTIGRDNYLLFLTADHGGTHSYHYMTPQGLPCDCWYNPDALKQANDELKERFGVDRLIQDEMEYTFCINNKAVKEAHLDRQAVITAACEILQKDERIKWAVDVYNMDKYPIPTLLKERIRLGYYPERSGEIYIVPRTDVYASKIEWAGSNHGTWNQGDTHIPLIFMGWHITPGETSRLTHMTDIAATVCALLHVQAPSGCIGTPIFE